MALRRANVQGPADLLERYDVPQGTCSVDECERPRFGRGWCRTHYLRWYRTGTADRPPLWTSDPPDVRFWNHVDKTATCWLWTSEINKGYGRLTINAKHVLAHRFAYELLIGPIPDGLELDHLCRVRHCVNPEHLEPVTTSVNVQRAFDFRAGHGGPPICRNRRHSMTPDNVWMRRRPNGHLSRECRACKNASRKRWEEGRPVDNDHARETG